MTLMQISSQTLENLECFFTEASISSVTEQVFKTLEGKKKGGWGNFYDKTGGEKFFKLWRIGGGQRRADAKCKHCPELICDVSTGLH